MNVLHNFSFLIYFILGACLGTDMGLAMLDEKRMISHLLANYERVGIFGRPIYNISDAVKVNISFGVTELTSFDIASQELDMVGWTAFEWQDNLLTWEPEDFGGVDRISIPVTGIWVPDVILVNSLSKPETIHETDIHVTFEGKITYVTSHKYNFYCEIASGEMDSDMFPCSMRFASWTLDEDQLELKNKRDRFDTSFFVTNRDWEFYKNKARTTRMDLPWGNGRKVTQAVYSFVLKRREPLVKEADQDNSAPRLSVQYMLYMCILIVGVTILN